MFTFQFLNDKIHSYVKKAKLIYFSLVLREREEEKTPNISHLCTSWIQVDFPHPEVPTKATVSPFLIVKDNPCRIGTSGLAGYLNSTSVNTMSLPLLSGRKPELR